MNNQEREVIEGLFERLQQAANMPRDAEAERFIQEKISRQTYAPYVLAQTVIVQEQALANLNSQLQTLQNEIQQLRGGQQQGGGSFLSNLFGGGKSNPQPSQSSYAPQPSQPQYAPQQQYAPQPQQTPAPGPWGQRPAAAGGGGFLQGALTTAAGVAGGMVVGNMLMNAFSGHHNAGQASAQDSQSFLDQDADVQQLPDYSEPRYDNADYSSADQGYDDGGDAGGDWV